MNALQDLKSDFFAVLSGDDPTATRAMLAGADGVISVAANVCPGAMQHVCEFAMGGRANEARTADAALAPVYAFLGVEPNPIPAKALLARMGRIGPALRLPLLELSAAHHAAANDCVAALSRIENAIAADRAA
jgi:4-hydroxy-tetrahydrodipicolinate synthase